MFLVTLYKKTQAYRFLLILLFAIFLGALTGYKLGPSAVKLKPLGDIFLNLMFTVVVPLVFFSVSSAIAGIGELKRVGKVITAMLGTFLFTGIIAAVFMLIIVKLYPPGQGVFLQLPLSEQLHHVSLAEQIVNIFTVSDFIKLFSRDNMLALIFFAALMGIATISSGEKGKLFAKFLQAGTEISMKATAFIMYYAPIGFFAYFAVL
ncbi:MAG: dicarboxylate symporter family protein, partial [Gammaproteobacteria bacterium]|nr:dicarboxylate symporter family protein [Gammaproteobacteria bacterium]